MALASATALSWRPLPPRPSVETAVARGAGGGVKNGRKNFAIAGAVHCGCKSWLSVPLNFSWRRNPLLCSPIPDAGGLDEEKRRRRRREKGKGRVVMTRAGMRLDPGGGGGGSGGGGIGRVLVNVALAGGLTYLTLTGQLGWVFDTVISLWLLAAVLPVLAFGVFLWFANKELVRGACPNCGQTLQVLEFTMKEGPSLCPYCSEPFKLDAGGQFVRSEARFSGGSGGFKDGFGKSDGFRNGFGRGPSRPDDQDPGGTIVDVEAKVVDRD